MEVEVRGTLASAVGRGGNLHERVQVSVRLLREEEQQTAAAWKRGDRLALHGTLREPGAARNFGGFDYRSHLRQQHIHWLLTLKGTEGARSLLFLSSGALFNC